VPAVKSNKPFLAAVALVGAVFFGSWYWQMRDPRLPAAALANVPSGATAVASIDVHAVVESTLWRELVVNAGQDRGLARLRERCGFDPLEQFDRIIGFVSGTDATRLDHVGFVAEGPFDHEKLAGCVRDAVREEGGASLRRVEVEGMPAIAPDRGDSRVAFIGSRGMAGGAEATVQQIIQTAVHGAESADADPELRRLWQRVQQGRDVVAVAHVPPHWQRVLQERLALAGGAVVERLAHLRALGAGLRLGRGRGLGVGLVLDLGSPEQAAGLVAALQDRLRPLLDDALISLSPAGPVLRTVHIEAQGTDAVVTADVREDRLVRLIELYRELSARRARAEGATGASAPPTPSEEPPPSEGAPTASP